MKATLLTFFISTAMFARAAVIQFDSSPPGSNPGVGLSPLNEVIPGPGSGSGNETVGGIFFNTTTMLLTLNVGYGSAGGFTDLSTPAFSWLLHGPAGLGETAPALFDLAALHTFGIDPARGGRIIGTLSFSALQTADLLAGLDYINIYTPVNPGGEIRGQLIVVPEPGPAALLLAAGAVSLLWRAVRGRRETARITP